MQTIGKMWLTILVLLALLTGCGTIKTRSATDQLLVSDAVDRSIAQFDFSPLAGSTVFLDTKYIRQVSGAGFVNADYIVAALRERMMMSGCVLEERRDEADYIAEVRVGALGTDGHEITYGIPASQSLNATANLVTNSPVVPTIPEISVAKRDERRAEVKLGVFAYHRESKQPVWHPGMVKGTSMAKATWVFGAGPFEQGTIYNEVQLAGQPLNNRVPTALAILGGLAPKPAASPQLIAAKNEPVQMRRLAPTEQTAVENQLAVAIEAPAASPDPQPTVRDESAAVVPVSYGESAAE